MRVKKTDPIGDPSKPVKTAIKSIKTLLSDLESVARHDRSTVLASWMVSQLTMIENADLDVVKSAFIEADLRLHSKNC